VGDAPGQAADGTGWDSGSRFDLAVPKKGSQGIAAGRPDHVEMIHRLGPVRLAGQDHRELSEGARIVGRDSPPPRVAGVEPLQEHASHRGLDLVSGWPGYGTLTSDMVTTLLALAIGA